MMLTKDQVRDMLTKTYNDINSMTEEELNIFLSKCEDTQKFNTIKAKKITLEDFLDHSFQMMDWSIESTILLN